MSADRNDDPWKSPKGDDPWKSPKGDDPRQFLAPSAPWIVDALAPTAAVQATIGHHIDGRLETGGSRSAPVCNPATGGAIGSVPLADTAIVDRAVAAAKAALPAWS